MLNHNSFKIIKAYSLSIGYKLKELKPLKQVIAVVLIFLSMYYWYGPYRATADQDQGLFV